MTTLHDFHAATIDLRDVDLSDFRGDVALVVNTASKCGFTRQYGGLETLYTTYGSRGFTVLGFPCDQFGNQEPGDEAEIKSFCSMTYGVTFPMFAKVEVNGAGAHPLFSWLQHEQPAETGRPLEWNFTKFLVDRDGHVARRYGPHIEPAEVAADVEALLGVGAE